MTDSNTPHTVKLHSSGLSLLHKSMVAPVCVLAIMILLIGYSINSGKTVDHKLTEVQRLITDENWTIVHLSKDLENTNATVQKAINWRVAGIRLDNVQDRIAVQRTEIEEHLKSIASNPKSGPKVGLAVSRISNLINEYMNFVNSAIELMDTDFGAAVSTLVRSDQLYTELNREISDLHKISDRKVIGTLHEISALKSDNKNTLTVAALISIVIAFLGTLIITRMMLKPVTEIGSQMISVAKHNRPPAIKYTARDDEIGYMARALQFFADEQACIQEERLFHEARIKEVQKLEAIGALAGGLAHEINTPIQFILNNTSFMEENVETLISYMKSLEEAHFKLSKEERRRMEELRSTLDIDFVITELSPSIHETREGALHIARIVRDMKDYAHNSSDSVSLLNLREIVRIAINLSQNEWRFCADIKETIPPDINIRTCKSEMIQVFINLIVNAGHAIDSRNRLENRERGAITISATRCETGGIRVSVHDNGIGMNEDVKRHAFDPFYTTKDPGKGTGQGLSVVQKLVTQRLNGSVSIESQPGVFCRVDLDLGESVEQPDKSVSGDIRFRNTENVIEFNSTQINLPRN